MKDNGSIWSWMANTKLGIGGGLMALVIGTILLIINERDLKLTADSIVEAESVVVEMNDANVLDDGLNGKLAYGVSKTRTDEILTDEIFDVAVNAIKLVRYVKYYQLIETEHKKTKKDSDGDEITTYSYTYKQGWASRPVNSSGFNENRYRSTNWVAVELDSLIRYADNVGWGAYELPLFITHQIDGNFVPVTHELSEERKARWEQRIEQAYAEHTEAALVETKREFVHYLNNTVIHFGINPSQPAIGDVRVYVNYIPPGGDLSVIAQVNGNTFTKYLAENGKEFYSVQNGVVGMKHMFIDASETNRVNAIAMRIMITLAIILGIRFSLRPLETLLSKVPLLGGILNGGVIFVSIMFGIAWSLIIIAVAWLFYRPLAALILFAIVVTIIFILKKTRTKESNI